MTKSDPAYKIQMADAVGKLDNGDPVAAEALADTLIATHPSLPGGLLLKARCASIRRDWPEAAKRWLKLAETFPDRKGLWAEGLSRAQSRLGLITSTDDGQTPADSLLAKAQEQVKIGAKEAAISTLRDLIRMHPRNETAITRYQQMLMQMNLRDEAVRALAEGHLPPPDDIDAQFKRLKFLTWLPDLEQARQCCDALTSRTRRLDIMEALLDIIPRISPPLYRYKFWIDLQSHLDSSRKSSPDPQLHAQISLRVAIALRDYSGFLDRFAIAPAMPKPWQGRFTRLASILTADQFPNFEAPKVFGIGLSKTGTTSLARALEEMGYLTAHYNNPFSRCILEDQDFHIFDAANDTPVCVRFESLFHLYPNARFILTTRDLGGWVDSLTKQRERFWGTAEMTQLAWQFTARGQTIRQPDTVAVDWALYYNHPNLETAYEDYMRRVDRFFSGPRVGKLLRLDLFAGDGWSKICEFLNKPIPDAPLPWANREPSSGAGSSRAY